MIIEDEELRELYKTSSSEHLQKLEAELMQLEKNPKDTKALEEFLREAHTLKGDSRMLGLDEIEMLVHQMEDCVEDIKQGKEIISSELCDRLYRGIDAVNQLAHTAITGEISKDPLLHLMRNAIDRGIETPQERIIAGKPATAKIILRAYQTGSSIDIEIGDDGRGLDLDRIKNTAIKRKLYTATELAAMSEAQIRSLIFASGFSTKTEITELSGRGVGLDVVRANVERLKGSIQVTSTFGRGCKFAVRVNTSLATTQVLLVEVDGTLYALPVEFVQTMLKIPRQAIMAIEDTQAITFEDRSISIAWLRDLLKLPANQEHQLNHNLSCVILSVSNEYFALVVDTFVDRQDIVFKPQSKLLKRIPNIAGATIIGNGEVCMILNPSDLLNRLRQETRNNNIARPIDLPEAKNKLLLVEDSIIIRTQMQRLLKRAGYDVTIAVDGLDGWQKLRENKFAAVVSDVEMPSMSGLELTASIRQQNEYQNLPIILVTTLASPEDRQRGREAGANAYLTKGDFDQKL